MEALLGVTVVMLTTLGMTKALPPMFQECLAQLVGANSHAKHSGMTGNPHPGCQECLA
jgi:hypothetical protein